MRPVGCRFRQIFKIQIGRVGTRKRAFQARREEDAQFIVTKNIFVPKQDHLPSSLRAIRYRYNAAAIQFMPYDL